MNWMDEGALYSSVGLFLREDLGRGDLTTQATIMRNAKARGRFVAGEKMIVAGLEAAEEVFVTLDPHLQLEAFASDGEEVEATKVIARTSGFADVLLAGERVALNLLQHLSGIATLTRAFVQAVEGTGAKISDTRTTTPGVRMLEKYAVLLGGGVNHRFGLDDGVFITANHIAMIGGVGAALKTAREKIGHAHKIGVEVADENDLRDAIENAADVLSIGGLSADETSRLVTLARELSPRIAVEVNGRISIENVRAYAETGADLVRVEALTQSVRAMDITFQMQPG